jgi:hypothetical protein
MLLLTVSACVLGLASGVRHAVEPDHVAAIGTFLAGGRGPRAAVRYAAAWGAGHGVMLVVCAAPLAFFGAALPRAASDALELLVAACLLALGVRGLLLAVRAHERPVRRPHAHPRARMAFAIGLVHGLAGSGALAALVAARLPSRIVALSFITLYALGATLGMTVLAGVLGLPLARIARSDRASVALIACTASISLIVGAVWATQIIVAHG